MKVYPNPVYDIFTLEFDLENNGRLDISIVNINGKRVKTLFNEITKKGRNSLSFAKNALSAGTYFVVIKDAGRIIKNEKLVVAE